MSVVAHLRRLRPRDKYLLFGAMVLLTAAAVYREAIVTTSWIRDTGLKAYNDSNIWRADPSDNWEGSKHGKYGDVRSRPTHQNSEVVLYKGRANLHAFEDWCGRSIAELRKNPHFPLFPHSRSTVGKLAVSPKWTNYGLRIFGYLHPYTDGEYVFALSSEDNSELWLSTDDSPLNVKLLAWVGKTGSEWSAPGEFEKYAGQISRPVQLSAKSRYFFEVLHKQDDGGTDHVEVGWQLQGDGSEFTLIESRHISLYVDESPLLLGDVAHVPQTAASHHNMNQSRSTVDMLSKDPRDVLYQVPLINTKFLQDVLPDCEYKPSYTMKGRPVGRYEGIYYVKMSFIYPNDHTRLTQMESENKCYYPQDIMEKLGFSAYMKLHSPTRQEEQNTDKRKWRQTFQINPLNRREHSSDAMETKCKIAGSLLIKSKEVRSVVKAFMEKLNQKNNGQFTLVQVVNVVKRADQDKGSRYLLELLLKDMDGQQQRLSQYVFASTQPEQGLCNPLGFSWNPAATVHIIVPVKNQARWVHRLISEMEKVFRETKDTNFNLIVTDYNSIDMDVEKALKESSLHRYQYLNLSGNFQRSAGLQAGLGLVEDIHDIVFLCDLHLEFPTSIIDSIRKHTVEGYMAFTPIVLRLDCGVTPEEARGFWEVDGYGLVGIYKSDLDAVGGMNTKEYTDRWGGEDWELLDRIFKGGLEVDRIYLRNFFHYYHSKRGMWNQKN